MTEPAIKSLRRDGPEVAMTDACAWSCKRTLHGARSCGEIVDDVVKMSG
jgi:hypothetical protein